MGTIKLKSVLGFVLAATLFVCPFSGCATKTQKAITYQQGYDAGFSDCDDECVDLQKKINKYIQELEVKNRVLKKFNQVDENNDLFNDDDSSGDDAKPEGYDSWAK